MNSDSVWPRLLGSFIRNILALAGGYLLKKGYIDQQLHDDILSKGQAQLLGWAVEGLAILWSARKTIYSHAKLRLAALRPPTTPQKVDAEVKALPVSDVLSLAFSKPDLMPPTRIVSALLIGALALGLVPLGGCTNKDVTAALRDAAAGAHSLALAANGITPPPAPGVVRGIAQLDQTLTKLAQDYAAAQTPDAQLQLLPTLDAAIDLFERDVMPLLHFGGNIQLVIAAIDAGLRIAANHFVGTATKVGHQPATFGAPRGVDSEVQVNHLKAYLRTAKVPKK